MISIAGVILPECAVWANENMYGLPVSSEQTDSGGFTHTYTGSPQKDIDLYIPNVKNGLKRQDAETLMMLAQSCSKVALILNERIITAIFRYGSNPVDIKPVSAKQSQNMNDIYCGTIRLREI